MIILLIFPKLTRAVGYSSDHSTRIKVRCVKEKRLEYINTTFSTLFIALFQHIFVPTVFMSKALLIN